jgi:fused signal recognition particle receptor
VNDQTEKKSGLFARFAAGLKRSSDRLSGDVTAIFTRRPLDAAALSALEDALVAADLGGQAAIEITMAIAARRFDADYTPDDIRRAIAEEVARRLKPYEAPFHLKGAKPEIILFVGVNGSGKTTTLGKIAARLKAEGKTAVIAAGDTFRAAAIEQLKIWGERAGAQVVAREIGADSAGLIFDAVEEAQAAGADVLLADTAGRLQNRRELMEELEKIVRVLKKRTPEAPHQVLLVLDATVGQNALTQAEAFLQSGGVTGLVMTKLDGTAKGGVLLAVVEKHRLPVHFIGVGEGLDDLQPFNAEAFARALAGVES